MLQAYLDESGDKATKVLSVGGYAATGAQWRRFSREWVEFLQPKGIDVFHMADLENGFHDFNGWKRQQKDELFRSLSRIINSKVLFQVWAAVNVQECEEVLAQYDRKFFATPYALCGVMCVSLISNWARSHWKKEPVVVYFEEGRKFSGEMFKLWDRVSRREWLSNEYKISEVHKASKRNFIPLQSADAFAYEINRRRSDLSAPNRDYLKWLTYPKSRGKFLTGDRMREFICSMNEDFAKYLEQAENKKR